MQDHYQNVIVGSGEGGKYLAWHLAQAEQSTVVVERRWIGGSCPNINCLSSKNEIWSAKGPNWSAVPANSAPSPVRYPSTWLRSGIASDLIPPTLRLHLPAVQPARLIRWLSRSGANQHDRET
jgi:cation diffusion facilitator CzcD-associated flavoprotein CzcO